MMGLYILLEGFITALIRSCQASRTPKKLGGICILASCCMNMPLMLRWVRQILGMKVAYGYNALKPSIYHDAFFGM
jgi:hypothetical protein